MTKEEKEKQKP